ncbi:MAG: hypothetical protein PHX61_14970 [Alphaproteobacteria bacterium]|nr:hypothetical protein [Alphaproteobacteria bacterium]
MKYILSSFFLVFFSQAAFSAELTPGNLIGKYKVEARAGFQKVYVNFRVLNTTEFEIQRIYSDGRVDESCNGTFGLNHSLFWDFDVLANGKTFNGVFTCPSNRSKEMDFNIDFKNTTTDDLVRGTNVTVTSSMARGMRINAYVKKQ